jgi:hypothetical protein
MSFDDVRAHWLPNVLWRLRGGMEGGKRARHGGLFGVVSAVFSQRR